MYLKFSYDDAFEKLLLGFNDKYSKEMFALNGISEDFLDITSYSKNYFLKKHTADSSIDQNANVQSNNVATYHSERFKAHSKLNSIFLLWKQARKLYGLSDANKLIELEFNKTINLQDGNFSYLPYCWNFATYDLILYGLPFIDGLPSAPPKHADSFLQHVIQMCMFASHQLLGATSIGDVLVVYSHLLKQDSLNENYFVPDYIKELKMFKVYIRQEFQKFVYTLNQPIRSNQSIFSNITIFDSIFLEELKKIYIFKNDELDTDFTMFVQKEFLEAFNDFNKVQLFTFPVLTVQFKINDNNDIEDKEFFDYVCKHNIAYANLNIFTAKNLTVLSSCCRLQSNIEDIIQATKEENTNLIGGSSLKVGSFGVTTLNLPRISFQAKNDVNKFYELLEEYTVEAIKLNNCRRELIKNMIEKNQLPLYKYNFIKLDNQYSTIGINGCYEAVEFMGMDILSDEGKSFVIKMFEKLQEIIDLKIRKYEYKINMEEIPAESTSIKFCKADTILYKQDKYKLYSNQFIPLTNETDLINRIELQALFEKYFTGGTICHVNVSEQIESKRIMKKLMTYIIKKGVKYFAINYFYKKCENNHITISDKNKCPICAGNIIENYTRIVGFLTPVSSWQKERREEFKERKKYSINTNSDIN